MQLPGHDMPAQMNMQSESRLHDAGRDEPKT